MRFYPFIITLIISVTMSACEEMEPGAKKITGTQDLYFNYSISAEEGNEIVTCKFEFRPGRRGDKTIYLGPTAKVELDGEPLQADSSKFEGVFYETSRLFQDFIGSHTIRFTSADGLKLSEEFEFIPFTLSDSLSATIRRQPFSIQLKDVPQNEKLQLIMVDTSFRSPDVNEEIVVKDGTVEVTAEMLRRVANGPVFMELHLEKTKPLKQRTREGGHLTFYYALKREFELTN